MSRLIFVAIGVFIVARLYMLGGVEGAAPGFVGVSVLASMVWFSDFWANTLMTFGFWESKATDSKTPQHSIPALVLMAWILLLLYAGFTAAL